MTQTAGALRRFNLPDVGEGLTEAEVLQWLVAVGDTVTVNQPLCEVETAKAAVELPSPHAGRVVELLVEAGATVDVGTPIITIDTGEGAEAPPETGGTGLIGETTANGRTAVLVGYGPRTTDARRRPRRTDTTESTPLLATAPDARSKPVRHGGLEVGRQAEAAAVRADAASSTAVAPGRRGPRPLAKPPVRRYAKDCGVDLATVRGTGAGGVITRADVDAARALAPAAVVAVPRTPSAGEQRIPIRGVRKHTAAAMVASAFTAPHVTEFLTVDVTRTMKLRDRLATRPELAELKLSPLLFVAKAVLLAIGRHPMINSSWDEAAQEIVVHGQVNLGIAAATPRGLVVPNIRDAGRMSLAELAGELAELTATARAGRTPPAAMTGGTLTITNVGVFGVDTGTPILNPGEAAILAFGAVRDRPWVHKGKIRVRQVTQLALSFDHRIVDGELGSRFLADVGAVLQDPGSALLG
ncbi:pyruvate dehydrogenase E2 component (dihydrolipoamide acetyltransferase) [Blastococcus aurantiacus]|uniref:Dihydrolipoamide acetyltransferase component of pyruvate dehydrogenase complex n=1 Tax=Blastococcus aurantiacus TaxID=1550231 RepID=A0A1G7NQE8_9ACTN|nr:dihydrolipoamide acetyltransferase family protein [Blastococcus aurantiacus]SDF75500.1 pyruvate dehydrogenase E2 component (dihydrolipoamide acetyltransferase) [Blastococcus aurantiacus]